MQTERRASVPSNGGTTRSSASSRARHHDGNRGSALDLVHTPVCGVDDCRSDQQKRARLAYAQSLAEIAVVDPAVEFEIVISDLHKLWIERTRKS